MKYAHSFLHNSEPHDAGIVKRSSVTPIGWLLNAECTVWCTYFCFPRQFACVRRKELCRQLGYRMNLQTLFLCVFISRKASGNEIQGSCSQKRLHGSNSLCTKCERLAATPKGTCKLCLCILWRSVRTVHSWYLHWLLIMLSGAILLQFENVTVTSSELWFLKNASFGLDVSISKGAKPVPFHELDCRGVK